MTDWWRPQQAIVRSSPPAAQRAPCAALCATASARRIGTRASWPSLQLTGGLPSGTLRVDIVDNTRRAFAVEEGVLRLDPAANVAAGTWETHAEGSPFATIQGRRFSTLTAFAAAPMDVAARVLTPVDSALLEDLGLPAASRQAIQRDLAAGHVVIIPAGAWTTAEAVGWWRIHPTSGATLGLARAQAIEKARQAGLRVASFRRSRSSRRICALARLLERRLVQEDRQGGVTLLLALRAIVYTELSVEDRAVR